MDEKLALEAAAYAAMQQRVQWGWTFGKRPKLMAIDMMMAEAAVKAYNAAKDTPMTERTPYTAEA